MEITYFKRTENKTEIVFELRHRVEGVTDLVRHILLSQRVGGKWDACITEPLTDPATFKDPNEAARELGKQLYRLAEAIMEEDGNFSKIDLTSLPAEG